MDELNEPAFTAPGGVTRLSFRFLPAFRRRRLRKQAAKKPALGLRLFRKPCQGDLENDLDLPVPGHRGPERDISPCPVGKDDPPRVPSCRVPGGKGQGHGLEEPQAGGSPTFGRLAPTLRGPVLHKPRSGKPCIFRSAFLSVHSKTYPFPLTPMYKSTFPLTTHPKYRLIARYCALCHFCIQVNPSLRGVHA